MRPFLAIDLLQAEILPIDGELWPYALFHLLQPDCCIINIGSKIVEVDVQGNSIVHFNFVHLNLLLYGVDELRFDSLVLV